MILCKLAKWLKSLLTDKSEYVYSFNATNSGFVAKDDGQSYSGVYAWNKAGETAAVPEPSTMLGSDGCRWTVRSSQAQKERLNFAISVYSLSHLGS